MKRARTSLIPSGIPSGILLAAVLGIASCVGADSDAEQGEVEQLSYLGNLGGTLGSPVATGSTSGLSNDYQPTCITNSAAPDAALPPTGLHLWLRADAGITSSGGLVSRWLDQSGNGHHASTNTVSRQPSLVPGALAGLPVLRFNGAQSLYMEVAAQPTNFTIFVVGKNSMPTESFSMILGPGSTSPNNQLRWENGSQALFIGLGNNMPLITSSIGNTRVYHALSASYNGAAMTVYRDGNAVSSHTFTTTGPWTFVSVGSWFSTYFMRGDLAEVIIYDRALAEGERAAVNEYLRTKYFNEWLGAEVLTGRPEHSPSSMDRSPPVRTSARGY